MQLHYISLLDLCASFTIWGWGSRGVIISMNEHQAADNDDIEMRWCLREKWRQKGKLAKADKEEQLWLPEHLEAFLNITVNDT